MFMLSMMGGMNTGGPDVCLTPIPTPGGPVPTPIPYVNISTTATTIPPTADMTFLAAGLPALNKMSVVGMSNGDEPGVNMGVASGMIMGPTEFITCSMNVMVGGAPAVKLTSMTGHNGLSFNCPGAALVPSQTSILVLG